MSTISMQTQNNLLTGVTERHRLLLCASILVSIGLVMVASASMGVADANYNNPFYFFLRHIIYLSLGLTVAFVISNIPLEFWQKNGVKLLALVFVLLILVLIPGIGRRINGSMRWLGFSFLTFQPSELAKLALTIYVSDFLVRKQDEVKKYFLGFLKPMVVVGFIVLLLMLEPDFGTSVVIVGSILALLLLAGAPLMQFIALLVGVIFVGGLAIWLEPYRVKRFISFTNPWEDQFNTGYQLTQSLIAFGRGEWFGTGLGKSVQKLFYLPEAHTDFVFAVYAEEFGLIGVLFMMIIFFLLIKNVFAIAKKAHQKDKLFAAYVAYGMGSLLAIQSMISMGVNMGVFPTKGLTLPLVSYGGSSLVLNFIYLGILLRIDYENNRENSATPPNAMPSNKRVSA